MPTFTLPDKVWRNADVSKVKASSVKGQWVSCFPFCDVESILRVTLTLMVVNPTFSFSFLFLGFFSFGFQDPLLNGVFSS